MKLKGLGDYYIHCSNIQCHFKFPHVKAHTDMLSSGLKFCSIMCMSGEVVAESKRFITKMGY